ncbi:MAG: serine hydrolase domain-containing protein [Acidobacteriota bacterium]
MEGRVFVRNGRQELVVELYKPRGRLVELGLEPDAYEVRIEHQQGAWLTEPQLVEGERLELGPDQFSPTQPQPARPRGIGPPRYAVAGRNRIELRVGMWRPNDAVSSLPSIAAGSDEAYVIPRLVAGAIDGVIFTPKLSFKNLSSRQCEGVFQLLEGDYDPTEDVFEFRGFRVDDGILPVSLSPGEGLSGRLERNGPGGYAGFGLWRQEGDCVPGQDVALTADVEVGALEVDDRYRIVDQIGLTASVEPSQRWGFAARREETAESIDSTAFAVVPSEPGTYTWTVDFFPESGIGRLTRKGTTTGPLVLFVHEVFSQDLLEDFAGYVTVSADKPVHLEALTVAWGSGVQGGVQYSNFPVRADAAPPYAREVPAEDLQQTLDQIRNDFDVVGISAAVVVHGQLVWTGVSGDSFPGTPITTDMYFDIGSIAKNYVATLILRLSEESLLSLDDPLSRWLPNFDNVNPQVTVRQLLGHTSGIANFTRNQFFWNAVFQNPTRMWTPEEVLSYIGPPDFLPGTAWDYSNTNYTLLGMIAERATGTSLSFALRGRLLAPLGLTHTFLEAEETVPGTIAHAWFDIDGDGRYDDISGINRTSQVSAAWAAGGMVAAAADLARWACALFEGKVLSADSLSQMLDFHEVSLPPTPITDYGLGTVRALVSGREYWGHGGDMIGYTAMMFYAPKERISIAILINQDSLDYSAGPLLLDPIVAAIRSVPGGQ